MGSISGTLANSQTITTTEHSLPADAAYAAGSPQTTDCMFQVFVNRSAMAAGDHFRLKIYRKINGQTARALEHVFDWMGAYSDDFVSPPFIVADDWDVTLTKIAGTDRSFHWAIDRVLP